VPVAETIMVMADVLMQARDVIAADGACAAKASDHATTDVPETGSAAGSTQANGTSAPDVGRTNSANVPQAASAEAADVGGAKSADVPQAAAAEAAPANMAAAAESSPADMAHSAAAAETSPAMTAASAASAAAGQCGGRHGSRSKRDRRDRRQDKFAHDRFSSHFTACTRRASDATGPGKAFAWRRTARRPSCR
jgi:hypothetical protein